MVDIYVFDRNFNLLGLIDEYVSIIWRPSFAEVGDFEIYLGATKKAVNLLRENNIVVRASDVVVDDAGNITYKKPMIIQGIHIVTDVENGDFLTVTGKELKTILAQRVVWVQTSLTGTAENAIRRLVNENAISPKDTNRKIPGLSLAPVLGLTDTISKQYTGDNLCTAIIEICTMFDYGWEVYGYNGGIVMTLCTGVDRSHGQTDRPFVVFSEGFENLYSTEYELNTESFANTALVGGEGEGSSRIFSTVGADNAGHDRFEVYVNASGVSRKVEKVTTNEEGEEVKEEAVMPLSNYLPLLDGEGEKQLATLSYTEGFTGEVLHDVSFVYEKDFFLGDLVTVINKYGLTKNVRVVSAIESIDESGIKLVPQFNI